MEPAAVLAREAIQNSVDAGVKGEKVRVEFRRVTLKGKAKAEFVAAMGLSPAITTHRADLKLPRDTCLDSLKDPKKSLQLLFIEDYGTCGLHGSPSKSKSHFFRLLLSLGDDAKVNEAEGSGGSYGFGKSVYSSNSRIHTIVAYSVFDPALSGVPEKNHARLMGCSYFNQHEYKEEEYSGRAWFGKPKNKGAAVDPLVDADAHAFAERLGFKKREENDRGTSLLLIDCGVECEILRDSIEEWWWPRLLDDELGLDIALYEQDQRLAPPRPRKRADLRPFIECFDLAIGRSMPVDQHHKTGPFNKMNDMPLGNFGYTVVSDNGILDERLQSKLGCVALVRAPRMVIEYMNVGGTLPLPCVGTFVAAPEIDNYLKRSEPACHDKWDAKSGRLSELAPEARETVITILQRLKIGMKTFARDAAPEAPKQELRLKTLEKLLGGLFRPPTSGPGGEGGSPSDPISIRFVDDPHVIADQQAIATQGTFRVALAENSDRDKVKVSVRVNCLVQEDEGLSKEDPIPVELQSDELNGTGIKGADGGIVFELQRSLNPLFSFKSQPYAPDWTTHVQVLVEEI
ncbi:hypothetical protein CR105_00280 [Massilia eurypsychrophila]|uniref:Uncharacterized protein n=2 Tax=Massilia eurypsychrophila TaxID=1485217 RepID=A0A2G8TKQ7_9BURK|nr:hypothetical protein CR105_00280 [Massilia eurypsychrophila]